MRIEAYSLPMITQEDIDFGKEFEERIKPKPEPEPKEEKNGNI